MISSIWSHAEKAEAAAKSIQHRLNQSVVATKRAAAVSIQTQWRKQMLEKQNDTSKANPELSSTHESDTKSGRGGGGKDQTDKEQRNKPENSSASSNHSLGSVKDEENQEQSLRPRSNTFSSTLSKTLQKKGRKNTSLLFFTSQDEECLEKCMIFDFIETEMQMKQLGKGSVEAHVLAVRELLVQWEGIIETNSSCIPSKAQQMLLNRLDSLLYPRISALYLDKGSFQLDITNVTPFEAAMIISLADDLLASFARNASLSIRAEWRRDMHRLVEYYMTKAVRGAMTECCDRALLLHNAEEIRRDGEFHLVTGLPELVSYMIEQQISVAKEVLPPKYLEEVVFTCNEVLRSMVATVRFRMGLKWKDIDSSFYCAIINDATRLAERCEERNELHLVRPEWQEKGNRLIEDLKKLSLQGTNLLCRHIISDLCEPKNHILTSVGGDTWQEMESGDDAVKRTVATLDDYFTDVKLWLIDDCCLAELWRMSLDHVVQIYLNSFFQNTMKQGIQNFRITAEKLCNDYAHLVSFYRHTNWENYQDILGLESYQGTLAKLGILCHMSAIIIPGKPQNLVEHVVEFLRRVPEGDGLAAILHLVGLRGECIRDRECIEWIEVIVAAKLRIAADRRVASVPLPDIRHSKYIRNFRRARLARVQRRLSVALRPHAQSILKLLDRFPNQIRQFTLPKIGQ